MIQQTLRRFINLTFVVCALAMFGTVVFAQYPIGQSSVGDMKPGSVLFYSRYSSNPANPAMGDTQINITNVNQSAAAQVHLFMVDGATCSIADSFVGLTPNQTASFLVSDYDPGISGYIVAVAVGGGGPTQFNHLIGSEFIRETNGITAYLQAMTVAKRSAGDVQPDGNGQTALNFNGVDYEQLPNSVAVSTFNSQSVDSSMLSLFSPSTNLMIGGVVSASVFTLLYNDAEVALSSSFTVNCYLYNSFVALFNRGGGINRHVPSGRTGWIRMTSSSRPLLGSVFGKGPVFVGGHNLHALSLLSSYSIIVPSF
ncbi:MAG: hypothetical protein SF097_01780 [Acidobacteriota bacterium]|nr:hypothetical protein [Acidobacteriota bacterium]